MWLLSVLLAASAFGQDGVRGSVRNGFGSWNKQDRIVGGIVSPLHHVPFQALVQTKYPDDDDPFVAGGVLIRPQWVLTAMHIIIRGIDPNDVGEHTVWLGLQDKRNRMTDPHVQKFVGMSIFVPDSFTYQISNGNLSGDVGLIKLDRPALLTNVVTTIRVPRTDDKRTFENYVAFAAGWGWISDQSNITSDVLRLVNVTVISNDLCYEDFGESVEYDTALCTSGQGGLGICRGDSGGPLYIHDTDRERLLIGISHKVATNKCTAGLPSVYMRVTEFTAWIDAAMNTPNPSSTRVNVIAVPP